MPVPVVLNEASYRAWPSGSRDGAECIVQIGEALRELAKLRRSVFLLTEQRLGDISVGSKSLREYLSDGRARDAIRQILAFANRSPFDSFAALDADGAEWLVDGEPSKGALYAHLLQTIAISFPSSDACSYSHLSGVLAELDLDGGDIVERPVTVPNIASVEHVALHSSVIALFRDCEITSGEMLWGRVGDWFPSLRFLPRVQADLDGFAAPSVALSQITARLFELEAALNSWGANDAQPSWRSKVTPESETRWALCNFMSLAGAIENYELHARYTPGAGRIHFRLLGAERLAEIAYIGPKLF